MAVTVAQVIAKVRSRHPAFDRNRVPEKALGDFLGTLQQELFAEVALRYPEYLVQTVAVALAPSADGLAVTADGAATTAPQANGYVVTIDAAGQPVIALDRPLVVNLAQGCPLPPAVATVLSGEVLYPVAGVLPVPLAIVEHRDARRPLRGRRPCVYVLGTTLFLGGADPACDFAGATALQLRYLPTPPPDFADASGVFLLREDALPVLAAAAIAFAAERVATLAGDARGTPDPVVLAAVATSSRMSFLAAVAARRRGRVTAGRRAYL